ncbi:MAG: MerR family transcriptional regulator, partial [Chloroflexota bacterium]
MDLDVRDGLGLADIAAKVDFSTEQVARMCGVSRRQLAYWAHKGIIPSEEGYPLAAVEKVLLIRKELDKGSTLRQAVQRVEERIAGRARVEAS